MKFFENKYLNFFLQLKRASIFTVELFLFLFHNIFIILSYNIVLYNFLILIFNIVCHQQHDVGKYTIIGTTHSTGMSTVQIKQTQ